MQRGQEKEIKGFTDIHAHFLYDLDDGAKNQREMEAMLDAAHREGIATLYATPHTTPGVQPFDGALYTQRLEEARSYCRKKGYEVRLNTGAEILCTPALERYARERRLYTLGQSDLVLIEFMPDIALSSMKEAIGLLERSGYKPVLAHMERYQCLFHGRNAWQLKRESSGLYQLNAEAVIEGRGPFRNLYIRNWLRDGLIDFVASDAHDCRHRPFRIAQAYQNLQQSFGLQTAMRLTGLS